jgi:hypothetical protein
MARDRASGIYLMEEVINVRMGKRICAVSCKLRNAHQRRKMSGHSSPAAC